jgi:protein-tyrosine kinase
MAQNSRLSLIERAAARLDLRSLGDPPVSLVSPVQRDTKPAIPFGDVARSSAHIRGQTGVTAPAPSQPDRRPNSVRFDGARLREISLVDWERGRTRVAEEFRLIKRQLLERPASNPDQGHARHNVVMITSALPREGRTFTALNLAISIAMEPHREVLLVDACDNENSIASVLPPTVGLGWLDLVTDATLNTADAALETNIPGLSVLLSGRRRRHGAELLASDKMQRLLDELSCQDPNRIILIDAPPCLASSDPSTLARVVGQTVFVVEAHTTQQQNVEAALEHLRSCSNTYLVLNKCRSH